MSNDRILLDSAFEKHRKSYEDVEDLGDAFEIFSADLVLKRKKLSIDRIRDGIVGGGKDGGLDSVYIFINGQHVTDPNDIPNQTSGIKIEVHFIQSKHAAKIEQLVLQKLQTSIPLFLELEPDQSKLDLHFNTSLQDAALLYRLIIKQYATDEYSVDYFITYACRSSDSPNDAFNDLAGSLTDQCTSQLGPANAHFEFFGAPRLYTASIQPTHTKRELTAPAAARFGDENDYIALVKLEDFVNFIAPSGELEHDMFEFNVRDYEGDTKPVNSSMAETIKYPPDSSNFWWFNNGVTVIASKIVSNQKSLVIHDPMIVNGLQTANVLFANRSAIVGKTEDDRRVLIKAIAIDDADLREAVIKATNSQTSLNSLALKATDPYQRQIEEYLKTNDYFYERRKNFYKNRQKASDRTIDVTRLGQAVISLNLHLPDEARARPGTFLNKDSNYQKVFPSGQALDRYLKAAALERKVDTWIRANRKNYDSLYRNNLRFHCLMTLAWNLMGKISKDTKSINLDEVDDSKIQTAFEWVMQQYQNEGGVDDSLSKTDEFTKALQANWTKPNDSSS